MRLTTRTCSWSGLNGDATSIHAVSSGRPSMSVWNRGGLSVAENRVAERAAAKRGFRKGAGIRFWMRTVTAGLALPPECSVRSITEWAPKASASRWKPRSSK